MNQVPISEVLRALRLATTNHGYEYYANLANRIEAEGIAPPDGLKAFALECLNVAFEGGDLDGGTIQSMGIKHGLLAEKIMYAACNGGDPDKSCQCADFCDSRDFEAGVTCCRLNPIMLAAAPKQEVKP